MLLTSHQCTWKVDGSDRGRDYWSWTPQTLLVRGLVSLKHPWAKRVAEVLANNSIATYVAIIYVIYLLWRYSRRAHFFLRSILYGAAIAPDDALTSYPREADEAQSAATEGIGMAQSSGVPGSGSPPGKSPAAAGGARSAGTEALSEVSASAMAPEPSPRPISAAARLLQAAPMATESLDWPTLAALTAYMPPVRLEKGEVLARAGSTGTDGMFVVISGRIGAVDAASIPPAGVNDPATPQPTIYRRIPTPLCVFDAGETVTESEVLVSPDVQRVVSLVVRGGRKKMHISLGALFAWGTVVSCHVLSIFSVVVRCTSLVNTLRARQWSEAWCFDSTNLSLRR